MRTIIDPGEARRFAALLQQTAAEIRQVNRATSVRLLELHGQSWDDVRYRQLERRYDEMSIIIQTFAERADRYADYLKRKAAPVERYLGRDYQ